MRVKAFFAALVLVLLICGCSGTGNLSSPIVPDGRNSSGSFSSMSQSLGNSSIDRQYWDQTLDVDGLTWVADYDPASGALWAIGEGVPVNDPLAYIDSHADIFKIGRDQLHLSIDEVHGSTRYVTYRQQINNIPMVDTRIDLRIKNGRCIAIGIDVRADVTYLPPAQVSENEAVRIALTQNPGKAREARLFAKEYSFGYHPFWRIFSGGYRMEISAVSGSILFNEPSTLEYNYSGEVAGNASQVDPLSPEVLYQINDLSVFFQEESTLATTDLAGIYSSSSAAFSSQNTNVTFQGPYALIDRKDAPTSSINKVTSNGVYEEFTFDDSNSIRVERNVFYWQTAGRNYITNVEPAFTGVDLPIVSHVNLDAWCNAQADVGEMFFYKPSGSCLGLGIIPDVVLHEYGHEIVFFHYLGVDGSECPYDIHEGNADYFAGTVTNQPIIGYNWQGAGTYIRNCDNTLWWPGNGCGGESHCLGQILAGAMWDVRERLGRAYSDELSHMSRYGTPDTFPQVAIEYCVADDDDGNLANGTPNYTVLDTSFNKIHGIPVPPASGYVDLSLDVTPDTNPVSIPRITGGSFGFNLNVVNNISQNAHVEAWVMVKLPSGQWYGPMIPPSHFIGIPVNLNFNPYVNFNYHVTQNIPGGLPVSGSFEYHVRLGDYIDGVNDVIDADDMFTLQITP